MPKYITEAVTADVSFPTTQGLLQNVRFIFDTPVEDVLLSRDCEVTKPGKRCLKAAAAFKVPALLFFLSFV